MYNRDWKSINNRLIRQGTLLLSLSFLEKWEEQLAGMNNNKVGRPYEYPNGLIEYAGALHCFMHLGYRQVKGILLAIQEKEPLLRVPDYSTICRRFNRLKTRIRPRVGENKLWIAVDSSGMCVTNRGEWMRKMHRKGRITECKGFLKVHIAVDVRSKQIVALEVTRENVADNRMFAPLLIQSIENTNKDIDKVFGDMGYDSYINFEICEEAGIEPVIMVRRNSAMQPPPDSFRNRRRKVYRARYKYAREQLQNIEKWKKEKGYGHRWIAESVFSALKRCYGKHVMARKFENMQQELLFKIFLYNQLLL